MNKNICIKILIVMLLGWCLAGTAMAKTSLDFGIAGVGARPMGMGKAYVALADDTNALFTNPAGLGLQENWGITSMSANLLGRVDYKLIGATFPTRFATVGIGYIGASTPAGYLTTDKSSLTGASAITYGASEIILSVGKNLGDSIKGSNSLGRLSVGANVKLLSNKFAGAGGSASGMSYDLGVLLRANDKLSLGLSYQNLGGSMAWESGTSEDVEKILKLGGVLKLAEDRLLVAVDGDLESDRPLVLHGGLEYKLLNTLSLRAGVDQSAVSKSETVSNLTAGVGIEFYGARFDYAYHQDNKLNDNSTHYFSIGFAPRAVKSALAKVETNDQAIDTKILSAVPGDESAQKTQLSDILSYYK